jgi:hypothetical protein
MGVEEGAKAQASVGLKVQAASVNAAERHPARGRVAGAVDDSPDRLGKPLRLEATPFGRGEAGGK